MSSLRSVVSCITGTYRKLSEELEQRNGFERVEKRCLHKSGRIVFTESSTSLIRGRDGEPQYFVGEVLDITERKLAEEALAGVSRKLLEAQEQERARIGRELHDDINQRLAILSLKIDEMKEVSPVTNGELRSRIDELGQRTSEISAVVQSLSQSCTHRSWNILV